MIESIAASGDGWRLSVHVTREDMAAMTTCQRMIVERGIRLLTLALAGVSPDEFWEAIEDFARVRVGVDPDDWEVTRGPCTLEADAAAPEQP